MDLTHLVLSRLVVARRFVGNHLAWKKKNKRRRAVEFQKKNLMRKISEEFDMWITRNAKDLQIKKKKNITEKISLHNVVGL